jgi:hypothetical protein
MKRTLLIITLTLAACSSDPSGVATPDVPSAAAPASADSTSDVATTVGAVIAATPGTTTPSQGTAAAQTGSVEAFCDAYRIYVNADENGPAAKAAASRALAAAAPAEVADQTALVAQFDGGSLDVDPQAYADDYVMIQSFAATNCPH